MNTIRIDYIDSLKAFAIFLVVLGHVPAYCYGTDVEGWSNFVGLFHMPLFFMLSGFLVNIGRLCEMSWSELALFLLKKAKQLIVPAIVILFLYCSWKQIDFSEAMFHDKWRAGYWFTFSLWEFFAITVFLCKILNRSIELLLLLIGFVMAIVFGTNAMDSLFNKVNYLDVVNNGMLKFFFFFALGIFLRKHRICFDQLCSSKIVVSVILLLLVLYSFISGFVQPNIVSIKIDYIFYGLFGCFFSYAYFYSHKDFFSDRSLFGRVVQCVGKRTLDIYLLPFFFLPANLHFLGDFFVECHNPSIEIVFTVLISIVVIFMSFLVGSVLRMTFLFGK